MNQCEFLQYLTKYADKLVFDEMVDDEIFKVKVKCNGEDLLDYVMVKCKCETADDVRQKMYNNIADELYKIGLERIETICQKKN